MSSYYDYERMQVKAEVAKFKKLAISRHRPDYSSEVSELVAAYFRNLDVSYIPYVEQQAEVYYDVPADKWEYFKSSLPQWALLQWVDRSLSFGWIRDMQTVRYKREVKRFSYVAQVTLQNYDIYVADNCDVKAGHMQRQRIAPYESRWLEIQAD
jgi:hypothetical protein